MGLTVLLHAIMVLTSIIGGQFEGFIDILAKLTGKLEIQIQFELAHRVTETKTLWFDCGTYKHRFILTSKAHWS